MSRAATVAYPGRSVVVRIWYLARRIDESARLHTCRAWPASPRDVQAVYQRTIAAPPPWNPVAALPHCLSAPTIHDYV